MCNSVWSDTNHDIWINFEKRYFDLIRLENLEREKAFENQQATIVKDMTADEFYFFLHDEYFVWRYTAKNRLATTRIHLAKHTNNLLELEKIHNELFSFDLDNIEHGLKIAFKIKGLGIAGASGLLAILFPNYFGSVDQFVLQSLKEFKEFENDIFLKNINEKNLEIKDGVFLINILRQKAKELNQANNINYWTPRKIDKVLWALNR